MEKPRKMAVLWAGTSALALLLSVSAFADSRPQKESWWHRATSGGSHQSRSQRDNSSRHERSARPERDQSRSNDRGRSYDRGRTSPEPNRDFRQRNDVRNESRDRSYRNDSQYRNDRNYRNDTQSRNYRNDTQYRNDRNYRNDSQYRNDRSYRNDQYRNDSRGWGSHRGDLHNGRMSEFGRVRSFHRERDGYRVFFDGGRYSYWIPDLILGTRRLVVGLSLRLGGIFRDGLIAVDLLGWPGDRYYNDPYSYDPYYSAGYNAAPDYRDDGVIRGVVDRVDYREGTLLLRDADRGGFITVDMRDLDRRYSRADFDDLRPGDRIALSGSWLRIGYFGAVSIDSVDAY